MEEAQMEEASRGAKFMAAGIGKGIIDLMQLVLVSRGNARSGAFVPKSARL
jgi:hypothetical protein